ncbi:MAG: hypothetical protein HPY66_0756 [Firmicutes bacterium]|nr:hypothetical protein [Bacillota bacterium]
MFITALLSNHVNIIAYVKTRYIILINQTIRIIMGGDCFDHR